VPYSLVITVLNSPPEVTNITVNPGCVIFAAEDLVVYVMGTDANIAQNVTFVYEWFVNGRRLNLTESVLPADQYRAFDEIMLIITPTDGVANGTAITLTWQVIPGSRTALLNLAALPYLPRGMWYFLAMICGVAAVLTIVYRSITLRRSSK
jgi:hypothetical protein